MFPYNNEIKNIHKQLVDIYNPIDIILFGSCAKGRVTGRSDIDICIILDTNDKRKVVGDILLNLDYDVDLDVVVYTPEEWDKYKCDKATFAGIINKTGVSLIGRYN